MKTVKIELEEKLAVALAQLCKRITWTGARQYAVDDNEAYDMIAACDKVREIVGVR